MPRLGMQGVLRLTAFKDVFIASGSGVGGGSLGFANTLYRARPAFFRDPQWEGLADWERELQAHYDTAERMLGVTDYEGMTPAESIQAVTAPDDSRDFTRSVAITSSIYPDPDTHIEVVTYGRDADAMSGLFTALTGAGTRVTRPLRWLAALARHPLRSARLLWPFKWSRRTVILLVMQSLDTAMQLRARRRLIGREGAAPDRAVRGEAEPDLHPGRRGRGAMVRAPHRRHPAERPDRVDAQHPAHGPHPRRRRDRRHGTRPCSSRSARNPCAAGRRRRSRGRAPPPRARRSTRRLACG
jgi:hypothetical protein